MKKLSILLAALALIYILPVTALAEEEPETPSTTPSDTEHTAVTSLEIDNAHIYEGMDKAFKDGYTPTVQNGTATLVLPLLANGEILGNEITVTPDLGGPESSPFVYSNYQKTVKLNDNTVAGGTTISSYRVRFDLPLNPDRYNGVYPVTISIEGQALDGSPIQQTFPTYVTITDGKDPNAPEPTPEPDKQTSQPKIIVSGYNVNPSPAMAGEEFTATITLKNTSKTKSVQNMAVTVLCDSPNFALQNESSTFYIKKLSKGKTTDIVLKYKTDLETPALRYNIMLSIEYDNSDAMTLASSGTVPVTVSQPLRVEMEAPQIPAEVNAGDTMPLSFQIINMGRSKVYNVRITLDAPGLIPSETAFIGNMEAGTAMPGEMDVFIGTKNMSEGYEGEDKYGYTNGKITLIYEDEMGQQYTQETEFSTTINAPVITQTSAEPEEEPEKAGQWWVSIIIGAVVIAALGTWLMVRKKKGKQHDDI